VSEVVVTVAEASLHITRVFPASAARLFECFTDPVHLVRWWGPQGTTCPIAEVDLQPGGAYRLEILAENGTLRVVTGEYLEINQPERLVFSWQWDDTPEERTRVTLRFNEQGNGHCELELLHERFPADYRATLHGEGWSSSLICLAELLATG
jgi:uncharacterized protein YndB with AHSA1/START domain